MQSYIIENNKYINDIGNVNSCVICLEEMSDNKKSICSQCNICIVCNNCIIKSMEEGIFNQKCFTCNKEYPWCTFHFNKKKIYTEIKYSHPCNFKLFIISYLIISFTVFIGFISSIFLNFKAPKNYGNNYIYIFVWYLIIGIAVIAIMIYLILICICIRSIKRFI